MNILVIGSFMMDLVVRTSRIPQNGETIIGSKFMRFPGGKGANQAVAAARLGGNVTMVGMLGNDIFGDEMIKVLEKENVDTNHILRNNQESTGIGSITLDKAGNNRIIVVPGANLKFSSTDLNNVEHLIKSADILVVQFEMDMLVIEEAVNFAYFHNVPVIVNPAPGRKLSDEFLSKVTYITPNETEAEILTDIIVNNLEDAEQAGKRLLEKGVNNVIITLAEKGAILVNTFETKYVPGFKVNTKDTVAAGDAFNGALAVQITKGISLPKAIRYANAAGAFAVTSEGAIPSLPKERDINRFLGV